jgi:hypothetical protein
MWCGILHNQVIVPLIFEEQQFLQREQPNLSQGTHLKHICESILNMAGRPNSFDCAMETYLDCRFPGRWLGRSRWPILYGHPDLHTSLPQIVIHENKRRMNVTEKNRKHRMRSRSHVGCYPGIKE